MITRRRDHGAGPFPDGVSRHCFIRRSRRSHSATAVPAEPAEPGQTLYHARRSALRLRLTTCTTSASTSARCWRCWSAARSANCTAGTRASASAGVGMCLGLVDLSRGRPVPAARERSSCRPVTRRTRKIRSIRSGADSVVLLAVIAIIVVFRGAYEQIGNTVALWADSAVDRSAGLGWTIPSTWFQALNPLLVFTIDAVVAGALGPPRSRRAHDDRRCAGWRFGALIVARVVCDCSPCAAEHIAPRRACRRTGCGSSPSSSRTRQASCSFCRPGSRCSGGWRPAHLRRRRLRCGSRPVSPGTCLRADSARSGAASARQHFFVLIAAVAAVAALAAGLSTLPAHAARSAAQNRSARQVFETMFRNTRDWLRCVLRAASAPCDSCRCDGRGPRRAAGAIWIAYAQQVLEAFESPGMSIAIAEHGQPTVVRSYGVRRMGRAGESRREHAVPDRFDDQGIHAAPARDPGR